MSHALLIPLALAAALELDPAFDLVTRAIGPSDDELAAVVEAPDGGLLLAGTVWGNDGQSSLALVRLDPFGRLDRDFADDGALLLRPLGASAGASALAVDDAGRATVAGYTFGPPGGQTDVLVIRALPGGELDPGFGEGGVAVFDAAPASPASDGANALVVDDAGRATLVGYRYAELGLRALVARLLPSGDLDPGFAEGGARVLEVRGDLDELVALALDDDGRAVAAGRSHLGYSDRSQILVARFLDDGALDPAFADAGIGLYALGPYGFDEGTSVLARGGRIAVGAAVEVGQLAGDLDLGALILDEAGRPVDQRVFSFTAAADGGQREALLALAPGPGDDDLVFAARSGDDLVVGALPDLGGPSADLRLRPCSSSDRPVALSPAGEGGLWLGFRCWQGFEHDFGVARVIVPAAPPDRPDLEEAGPRVDGPVVRPEIGPPEPGPVGCACASAAPADAGLFALLLLALRALSWGGCRGRRRSPSA